MLHICTIHDRYHAGSCPECAATMPPDATEADDVRGFEDAIARDGETSARFDRLMNMLEGAHE